MEYVCKRIHMHIYSHRFEYIYIVNKLRAWGRKCLGSKVVWSSVVGYSFGNETVLEMYAYIYMCTEAAYIITRKYL